VSNIELVEDGELIESLLVGVSLEGYDPNQIHFAPELGFMAMTEGQGVYALGFHTVSADACGPLPTEITPVTDLRDVPSNVRHVNAQGKGVGPRLHNTLPMISGIASHGPTGLYGVQISPDVKLRDTRSSLDGSVVGKGLRIARHAGRIARAHIQSVERVVDSVHRSYGDAGIVILSQSPHDEKRQKGRGVENVPGVNPSFMIVRDSSLELTRVGFVVS